MKASQIIRSINLSLLANTPLKEGEIKNLNDFLIQNLQGLNFNNKTIVGYKYQDYFKDDESMFQYFPKNKSLAISYNKVWAVLEKEFGMDDCDETMDLLKWYIEMNYEFKILQIVTFVGGNKLKLRVFI